MFMQKAGPLGRGQVLRSQSSPALRSPAQGLYQKLFPTELLLEKLVVTLLFILLLAGTYMVLRPFSTAFLFGGIVATATWPLHEWMIRKGLPNSLAAVLLCGLMLLCLIGPILALGPQVGSRMVALVQQAQAVVERERDLPRWVVNIPLMGAKLNHLWHQLHDGRIHEILAPYGGTLRSWVLQLGTSIVDAVLQILLSLIVATMFWLRGQILRDFLVEISQRLGGPLGPEIVKTAVISIRGISFGIVGTAAAQALALTAGLAIAGVPNAALLGFLAFVIALSQLGILLVVVWGGAAYGLYSMGETGWALFMIVWGLIVSTMDNVMRPILMGVGASMPMTLVFLGVFGGLLAFGFLGMFIGPTVLAILFAVLQSWRGNQRAATEASGGC